MHKLIAAQMKSAMAPAIKRRQPLGAPPAGRGLCLAACRSMLRAQAGLCAHAGA